MADCIQERLNRIRQRMRHVLWLQGLSLLVAVVFGGTLAVALLDWLVHLDDPGVRLILGLTILGSGLWVSWRFLLRPLRARLSDVDLALRVEKRFRGFNDSLASSVEFLQQGTDARLGSPALQDCLISQTRGRVKDVDTGDVIETRGMKRVAGAAIVVCLLAALLVGLNPVEATIALNRLAFPLRDVSWPQTTELRLLGEDFEPLPAGRRTPLRAARGQSLQLYVENLKGGLPDDVQVEYRFSDGEVVTERVRKVSGRDAEGRSRELGVTTLVVARGPVRFRAVGGDDRDNPYHRLVVVPPPLVEELQVTLTPPAYSGRQPARLSEGVGHVEGLLGTRVSIEGTVNKPLENGSAALRIKDRPPMPLKVSSEGQRFEAEFVIERAGVGSYWFDLRDREGFENPEAPRYEIRGIADLPPDVQIRQPPTDMYVTADAELPLVFQARDDLALKDVRLHYRLRETSDAGGFQLLRDGRRTSDRPTELLIEHTWPLAELSLSQGTRLVFHAEATDHYDLGPEHVGRSISRTLTVVSPEEKAAELASRQAGLLDELDRAFKTQSAAREQVGELLAQLDNVGALRPEDVDLLKRLEIDQRQITSRLLNPIDGIGRVVEGLGRELDNNKIDSPQMRVRLEQMADELVMLGEDYLPAVEQQLTRARKAAELERVEQADGQGPQQDQPSEGSVSDSGEQQTALQRAGENQVAVLESLRLMRRQLSEWRSRRDLLNELDELVGGQEGLKDETAELGKRTLGRFQDLSPQERAELEKLSVRQRALAGRLGEFDDKLRRQNGRADSASPDAGAPAAEAQQLLRRAATGHRMRTAAEQLAENRIGEAARRQEQVLADLHEVRKILNNRRPDDTETLVKQLKDAEAELSDVRERQHELLQKTEQALQASDSEQRREGLQRLKKQQRRLRNEAEKLSRRLLRIEADGSGEAAGRAADRMLDAEDSLADGAAERAPDRQQEALADLQQARRELARERRRAQERLAREMLERISDELESMVAQQQAVIDEVKRLETERRKRGNWSRGQLKTLRGVEQAQRQLKADTDRLAKSVDAAEVFAMALEGASRMMQEAADRLSKREAGDRTVAVQEAAKQRFLELEGALKSEGVRDGSRPTPGQGAGGQAGGGGDRVTAQLTQLKVLKSLQESLLQRTAQLDERRRDNGGLTTDEQEQLKELADEQGRLADLMRNLTAELMKGAARPPETPVQER